MERKNCWEVLKCGREPGGYRVSEAGVCPTYIEPNSTVLRNSNESLQKVRSQFNS